MIIGIPTEVKDSENRVGIVPAGVRTLVQSGHDVIIQSGAGSGSAIGDDMYVAEGARLVESIETVYANAEMIIKVKEPIAAEYDLMQPGQIIYAYFHLAAVPELADILLERKVTSVAYETIEMPDHTLPLLKPMSEVAGKMSVQIGAIQLQKDHGGKGQLLGGIPGVKRGNVVIVGAGTVGINAAKIAIGLGAEVTILDIDLDKLGYVDDIFGNKIITLASSEHAIEAAMTGADLVIGGVLIPGAKAPKLIKREMIGKMAPGSVFVDVAIDQGGCSETSRATSHREPTYVEGGVIHYCVTNIPGIVAMTSTYGLTNSTFPYAMKIANHGLNAAIESTPELKLGVNTYNGAITHPRVAEALQKPYVAI